ncbi:hypothetical protein AAVH_27460 [Aphelenchoides avenae]|nr:hypothetical protein AAVH_27460 [Aphelenchus avenae]
MFLKFALLLVCALAAYATTEQGDAEAAKLVDEIVRLLPDVEAEPIETNRLLNAHTRVAMAEFHPDIADRAHQMSDYDKKRLSAMWRMSKNLFGYASEPRSSYIRFG